MTKVQVALAEAGPARPLKGLEVSDCRTAAGTISWLSRVVVPLPTSQIRAQIAAKTTPESRRVVPRPARRLFVAVAQLSHAPRSSRGSLGVYAERLAAEREVFAKLDVQQLDVLAEESQRLVDKAMEMLKANANALTPGAAMAPRAQVDGAKSNGEPAEKSPETDVDDA